ncbi:MAG: magnesium/cobalt transporter CorA [Leptolyngbyaceae cyanobacterium MO_188.B28]|nr:magnesium/cobalt transporter CorA [Leptolyngbyaceae cyanobacterium MO_188.B28]
MDNLTTKDDPNTGLDYFYDSPGTIPGVLSISSANASSHLVLIDYNETTAMRTRLATPEECEPYLDSESVSWLDVQGLGNVDVLHKLGDIFHLHPLVLEDIVNVPQRPKVEIHGDQLIIITRMMFFVPSNKRFVSEQISFVLGEHYLLTVQEEPAYDCFEPIRSRIKQGKGAIRHMGADYLAYALLDAIVDGFFPVLEAYGERLEDLEDEVVAHPNQKTLREIYRLKREMSTLRRLIWLQRDTLASLLRNHGDFISQDLDIYLRDCYDHAVQLLDIVESYKEACAGLMNIYLSAVSNRMNEVMKTLTVISTIFIPMSFVVGIYGMNFNPESSPLNMPELNWYWGYPSVWLVMAAITLGMFYFFWRRGWFKNFF